MRTHAVWRLSMLIGVGWCGIAAAMPANAPPLAVIGAIEPGQWELRDVDATADTRLLCVTDPDMLIQLRHARAQCTRYVVENLPQTVTVNYDCNGAGSGRTTISLDTPRQIRLQTQGIEHAGPFDADYAGRRVGNCPASR